MDVFLKRVVMLYGGIKMVENLCEVFGYELDLEIKDIFIKYRKIYN